MFQIKIKFGDEMSNLGFGSSYYTICKSILFPKLGLWEVLMVTCTVKITLMKRALTLTWTNNNVVYVYIADRICLPSLTSHLKNCNGSFDANF